MGIVIVNYNGAKVQNNCIRSILRSDFKEFKIIVIDNHSKDNSMELLNEFPDDRIIKIFCEENYGIAKGNNIGIAKSKELGMTYTLLLNNDTLLPATLLTDMVENISEDLVIVPKIYYPDGNVLWYGGGKFIFSRGNARHLHYQQKDEGIQYEQYYNYSPTTCMLIHNSVFDRIGYMDEKYFLYFDDTDFCYRLYKNNIKIKFLASNYMIHLVGMSSGGDESKLAIYYMSRNKMYFVNKYKKDFSFLRRKKIYLAKLISYYKGIIKRNNNRIIKKALKDYRLGRMGRCDNL